MTSLSDALQFMVGRLVVAEIGDDFTVFAELEAVSSGHLFFRNADLHLQSEANSSRDVYAIETKEIGIRPNRATLLVPMSRLISICPLEDVVS